MIQQSPAQRDLPPPEQLVVGSRREKLAVLFIPILVLGISAATCQTAFLTYGAVSNSGSGSSELWLERVVLVVVVFTLNALLWGYLGFTFVNRLLTKVALVVDREGVRLFHRPTQSVFLPWEVLAPVTGGAARLRFKLRPEVGIDHPGITGLDTRLLRWALRRQGLQIGMFGLTADRNTIAHAVWYLSAGRVHVT